MCNTAKRPRQNCLIPKSVERFKRGWLEQLGQVILIFRSILALKTQASTVSLLFEATFLLAE